MKFSDTSAYIEGFSTKKFDEYLITKNECNYEIEYEQAKTIFFLSMTERMLLPKLGLLTQSP